MKVIIYRLEDENTRPGGFGFAPTYHFDEPRSNGWDMQWVTPIEITLPEGYSIKESYGLTQYLYDDKGKHVDVIDDDGHPAIHTGKTYTGKDGRTHFAMLRLDKA